MIPYPRSPHVITNYATATLPSERENPCIASSPISHPNTTSTHSAVINRGSIEIRERQNTCSRQLNTAPRRQFSNRSPTPPSPRITSARLTSVLSLPRARRGPAGGLPRAPDGTGRLAVVCPGCCKGRTAVFRQEGGPYSVRHVSAGQGGP